jgi:uncharacterized membrane protein
MTMILLVLGLVLFLGVHSVRIVADGWRTQMLANIGAGRWKAIYSMASLAGFASIIMGFGIARANPEWIWVPPVAMRHVAALLTLVSFVLLAAAYVPGNSIKAAVHHPMILAVKVWALAHLLANGTVADTILFGGFLLWSVLCFRAARQRDRVAGTVYPKGSAGPTVATVAIGAIAWAAFAFWLHGALIGVRPFG